MSNLISFEFENKRYEYPFIEYKGEKTLVSAAVADFIGSDNTQIAQNFKNNFNRFKIEKDYFYVDSVRLATLKTIADNVSKYLHHPDKPVYLIFPFVTNLTVT